MPLKNASNTPTFDKRQNRVHTEFHGPYSAERNRHVTLLTVK